MTAVDAASALVRVPAEARLSDVTLPGVGITVRLAAPRPPVAKLLHITGLDRSLTICAKLPAALAMQ
jgi:hypothetical protein